MTEGEAEVYVRRREAERVLKSHETLPLLPGRRCPCRGPRGKRG